jgi:hypothetical protein
MQVPIPFRNRCRTNRDFNNLDKVGSQITSTIAKTAACGLVLSSMGFGALFAWQSSIAHGVPMAALTVLFALCLEASKPLAVAGVFVAFRSWAVVRGLALACLAIVAVAYSLTAELSLIAGSRGDLAAKREASIEAHTDRREAVKAARAELATIAPARTIEEAKADVAKLLAAYPKAGDCKSPTANASARYVCPKVAALVGEQARAKRRAELQSVIDKATTTTTTTGTAVKSADPGSAALATYLAGTGLTVSASTLADYLTLAPVLALEVGAALSGVLVQSVGGGQHLPMSKGAPRTETAPEPRREPVDTRAPAPAPKTPPREKAAVDANSAARRKPTRVAPGRVSTRRLGNAAVATKAGASAAIVDTLRDRGGRIENASVRGLASLINATKSNVHNALMALVAAGVVARVAGGGLVLQA